MNIFIDMRHLGEVRRGLGVFCFNLLNVIKSNVDLKYTIGVKENNHQYVKSLLDNISNIEIKTIPNFEDPFLDFLFYPIYFSIRKFDLVHFTSNSGFVPLSRHRKIFTLLTLHDVSFLKQYKVNPASASLRQLIGRYYRRIFIKFFASRSDKIVTVSMFASQDIKSELNLNHHPQYVYHSIHSPHRYVSTAIESNHSVYKFCVISGLDKQKNLKNLIKAFIFLYNKYLCKFHLDIYGVTEKDFRLLYPNLSISKNIKFLGYVPNDLLIQCIPNYKAMIIPSYYESFCIPLIEAMHSRIKVICSNTGALPEIGSTYACYFNPHIINSIVNSIKSSNSLYINNNEIEDYLIKNFSFTNFKNEYINIYKNNIIT
jgi:glycosyltransferase involved in cell wall biosynthesis